MANATPKSFEVRFAYQLLRYLGGNVSNSYLILAIIAWVRRESGQNYIGNNPLNIRYSRFASGYRFTSTNGRFAKFSSLQMAAKASAEFLKQRGYGYEAVVKRLREQMPSGLSKKKQEEWLVEQAIDFMWNIALSKWSATHYGLGRNPNKNMTREEMLAVNKLVPIWASMTGTKWSIPKDAEPQPKKPKPLPYPKQPRTLEHAVPKRPYLDPYEASKFYEARWAATPIAPGEPVAGEVW